MQGGVEYAAQTARRLTEAHVGSARNGDLRHVLDQLPRFFEACLEAQES